MNTTAIAPAISRINLPGGDDSYRQIVTVSMPIEGSGIGVLKPIVSAIEETIELEVRIPRPCSAYDCTGQWFTISLDVVDKFIHNRHVHYVLSHYVCLDV